MVIITLQTKKNHMNNDIWVCVCMILMHFTETHTFMNISRGISIANRQLSSQTQNWIIWFEIECVSYIVCVHNGNGANELVKLLAESIQNQM